MERRKRKGKGRKWKEENSYNPLKYTLIKDVSVEVLIANGVYLKDTHFFKINKNIHGAKHLLNMRNSRLRLTSCT